MRVLSTALVWLLFSGLSYAQDSGKDSIARLRTILLFGTHEALEEVVPEAKAAAKAHSVRVQLIEELNFSNYALLGSDTKPVLRSYTNWASPMKGRDDILLSFEPHSVADSDGLKLDLELWQGKRKVMKSTQPLKNGKWLYIAGPQWRGGRLIVGIELLSLAQK